MQTSRPHGTPSSQTRSCRNLALVMVSTSVKTMTATPLLVALTALEVVLASVPISATILPMPSVATTTLALPQTCAWTNHAMLRALLVPRLSVLSLIMRLPPPPP